MDKNSIVFSSYAGEVFIMRRHILHMSVVLILNALLGIPLSALADADMWTEKAGMPTARHWLSTSVVNGRIYAIGGSVPMGGDDVPLPTVEEYDPKRDIWTEKADMLTARKAHSTSAVNGKIYVFGGFDSTGGIVSAVDAYDPATDRWTRMANMLIPKADVSTCAVSGMIYAIGGRSSGNWFHSTVEEYDPVTGKWRKRADMPTARGGLSTSVVNGKIYAIDGWDAGFAWLSEVVEYDPGTDIWRIRSNMPVVRGTPSSSVVDERIYVVSDAAVEEYDPATDRWKRKADMLTPRFWSSTSAVAGRIYAIGGQIDGMPLSIVEEYDTGFAIEPEGKLAALWGEIRAER